MAAGFLDNVTHSLIGHALASATSKQERDLDPRAQSAAIWTSVLASNAGDLDFVAGFFADDRKLAYLLHHRGHTHTLLFAVPIGLAIAAICALAFRVSERCARLRLLVLGVVAALLHIGFDALNDYGVHPFYPLDDRWYYGDSVFIVEPWLLAVLLPQLVYGARSRVGRGLGIVLCLALSAIVLGPAALPWPVAITSTLLLGAMLIALRKQARRAALSLGAALIVVLAFVAGATLAKRSLARGLARAHPNERVAQLATTPMPANPLCHRVLIVSTEKDTYRARIAHHSLLPSLVAHAQCAFRPALERTAPLERAQSSLFHVEGVFSGALSELRALAATRCDAEAALRFLRVAFWTRSNAAAVVLGDLRYDHELDLGFAELRVTGRCRDRFPDWVPPLDALLRDSDDPR